MNETRYVQMVGRGDRMRPINVTIEDRGAVLAFRPRSGPARDWMHGHTPEHAEWVGGDLVVRKDGSRAYHFQLDVLGAGFTCR